jgi:hypothetical protein
VLSGRRTLHIRQEQDGPKAQTTGQHNAQETGTNHASATLLQIGGIDLESSHKHKKQHADLEHGVTPHGDGTRGRKQPRIGVGCKRAQNSWPQENAPKQLAEDGWLAQGTHDLATDESCREHGAYLEGQDNHIVVLHNL